MSVTSGSAFRVDTHVHVFERGLPLAAARRYQPDYDATPGELHREMVAADIAKAILVQPSFLGTDNSYVLNTIASDPRSFAGIAVIEPDMESDALATLKDGGVVGIRLNCIGQSAPDLAQGVYHDLADRLAELGLVMQIQSEGEQWLSIVPALGRLPCTVLIDHFGRTPPGDASGGFEALLSAARDADNIWFKFSGSYRFGEEAAASCAASILDAVGAQRVLWGSDWPWTQFEGQHGYVDTLRWLDRWVPDAGDRQTVLADNPARLFGFKFQQ
jgi:predicted TIM-barrel fold metal-dependent hydrolase